STAFSFVFVGVGTFLNTFQVGRARVFLKVFSRILGFLTLAVGSSALIYCYGKLDLGFDSFWWAAPTGYCQNVSLLPSFSIICLGFASSLFGWKFRKIPISQGFTIITFVISMLGILD